MRTKLLITVAFVATAMPVLAATLPPETALIEDGPVKVEVGDFESYLQMRVPANRRLEVRSTQDRVAGIADQLFVARSLAAKARALGLDKDDSVKRRVQQLEDGLLADLYMQHLEKTASASAPALEQRVRELYLAEPSKYVLPEQVYIQHILVSFNGRTREMAQERAQKIYEEIKSGKEDFLALAARLSDDPDKKRNGGDLGFNSPSSFVPPVSKQIAAMNKAGEVSAPVESSQGFHIIKFVERTKPRQLTFDEVKEQLVSAEKERLNKKSREEAVTQIRSTSTVTVHVDKLKALVVPVDDVLAKAAAEAARQAGEPPKQQPR